MNLRTTFVLLILVLVAAGAAIILQSKVPPTDKWAELSKKVFKDYESGDATKLEIKTKDRTLAFEKKDDKWQMSGPLKVRADKSAVMGILDGCESLQKERDVEAKKGEETDLAKFGLKEPEVTITFWAKPKAAKEEIKRALLLGKKTPGGENVYARVDGQDGLLVIGNSLLDKAGKETNEFRDKVVIDVDKDKVEKMELACGDAKPIECSMKEKEGWLLTQPVADLGDKDKIEEVLNKLKDLRLEKGDFVSEDDSDLKKYGLDSPRAVVTVYQGGAAKTLLLGKPVDGKADKIYAKCKAEPSILAVNKTILDDLKKEPKDLRSRKVINLSSTGDVTKIEVKLPSQDVVVEKKDDKWTLTKPSEEKADSASVDEFLDDVKKLSVDDWAADKAADLKPYGLDKPIEVSLFLKEAPDKPVTFLVGSKDKEGKKLYVKRAVNDPILTVAPEILDNKLLPGRLTFRDKKLLEFNRADAKKLTVARKDKTFVCVADEKENWRLEQPIKAEADKAGVDSILWDLAYLKAKNFVAESPKDLKAYGLDAPAVTVTLEYDQEVKKEELKKEEKAESKTGDKAEKTEGDQKDAEKKEAEKKPEEKKDDKAGKDKPEEKPKKERVTKVILVGGKAKDEDYYGMVKGDAFVFTLRNSIVEHLNEELASKKICAFDKEIAVKVTLNYPAKEVVYEKKADRDNKWWLVKPTEKKAAQSDIDDLLNDLSVLNASAIESYTPGDPAKYGFDKPSLKITVALRGEGEKVILIGKKNGDKAQQFVRCQPCDFVFLLNDSDAARLRKEAPEEPKKDAAKPDAKPAPGQPPAPAPAKKAEETPAAQPAAPKPETKPAPAPAPPKPETPAKPQAEAKPAPAADPKAPAPPAPTPAEKK